LLCATAAGCTPLKDTDVVVEFLDTDRGKRTSFDRQASATDSASFPGLFPPNVNKTVFLFVSFHQRSDAVRNLVPRFDRARNLTPSLRPSPLAV
jgi:hypothetical protein